MAGPAVIAQQISSAVERLQNTLASHHGVLRGTMQAVLAEAQGGALLEAGPGQTSHLLSMEQAAAALINNNRIIVDQLNQLRTINPQAAGQLSQSLRPLLDLTRQRIDLMEQVEALAVELEGLHPQRLEGMPLICSVREASGLITTQLSRLTAGPLRPQGVALVPGGIAVQPWVQNALQQIRQLPVNAAQAMAQVNAAMMGVRVALQTAAAGAGSALLEVFGAALDFLLLMGGSLISIPLLIVPVPSRGGGENQEA
jgi:hypothetical protein